VAFLARNSLMKTGSLAWSCRARMSARAAPLRRKIARRRVEYLKTLGIYGIAGAEHKQSGEPKSRRRWTFWTRWNGPAVLPPIIWHRIERSE
jgi:hypothetical protein